jgi:hypothetical protein
LDILNILKTSGALPVNELNLLTSGSTKYLVGELEMLRKRGLVEFDGQLPAPEAVPDTILQIRLTKAGLKQSLG